MIESGQIDLRDPEIWNSSRSVSVNSNKSVSNYYTSLKTNKLSIQNLESEGGAEDYPKEEFTDLTIKDAKKNNKLSIYKKVTKKISGLFNRDNLSGGKTNFNIEKDFETKFNIERNKYLNEGGADQQQIIILN